MSDHARSQELLSLWLQLLLMILFAAVATVIALYSDSETMALESTSNIVDIVVSILAIFVARKVAEPANQRYQFGYAKYEPLMTTVEGILMTGICTSAILSSVQDILHPDPFEAPYLIVIYAAASFLISVIFGVWMRSVGKRAGSPLVHGQRRSLDRRRLARLRGVCSVCSQHRPWPHGEDRGRRLH